MKKHKRAIDSLEANMALFAEKARDLSQRRAMQSDYECNVLVSIHHDIDSTFLTLRFPSENDTGTFLFVFAQFITQSEPIFIQRIFSDCIQRLPDGELKSSFAQTKQNWDHTILWGTRGAAEVPATLTPEHVIEVWINGFYFNKDPKKYDEVMFLYRDVLPVPHLDILKAIKALGHMVIDTGRLVEQTLRSKLLTDDPS